MTRWVFMVDGELIEVTANTPSGAHRIAVLSWQWSHGSYVRGPDGFDRKEATTEQPARVELHGIQDAF